MENAAIPTKIGKIVDLIVEAENKTVMLPFGTKHFYRRAMLLPENEILSQKKKRCSFNEQIYLAMSLGKVIKIMQMIKLPLASRFFR